MVGGFTFSFVQGFCVCFSAEKTAWMHFLREFEADCTPLLESGEFLLRVFFFQQRRAVQAETKAFFQG